MLHTMPRAKMKKERRALAGQLAQRRRMNQKMRRGRKQRKTMTRRKWVKMKNKLSCNDVCREFTCASAIVLLRMWMQVQLNMSFCRKTVQIFE